MRNGGSLFLKNFVESVVEKATDSKRRIKRLKAELQQKERLCEDMQNDLSDLVEDPELVSELRPCLHCGTFSTQSDDCSCRYLSSDSEQEGEYKDAEGGNGHQICNACPEEETLRLCEGCGTFFCPYCNYQQIEVKTWTCSRLMFCSLKCVAKLE